ncbi:hypothetical protein [Falsiroseomonas oryzae]|uniref:hypothetical protein n=1 Tax=Falsiroseomonas oryzae TaxID=2766473 RepID=UPI0022EA9B03|nr:hypothetical protein [Roseomonas sp. MO-31]
MRRSAAIVLFAFLGFLFAFAGALPAARSGMPPAPAPAGHDVPLEWVARALAEMPFIIPGGR